MNDWIEWKGGECPVLGDVKVLLRDGHESATAVPAHHLSWRHINCGSDIIAYCVVESEKPAEQQAKPCPWKAGEWAPAHGGGRALIYCTDAPGNFPIHGRMDGEDEPTKWQGDGLCPDRGSDFDLLPPPRVERVVYMQKSLGADAIFFTAAPTYAGAICIGSAIVREGEHHDR